MVKDGEGCVCSDPHVPISAVPTDCVTIKSQWDTVEKRGLNNLQIVHIVLLIFRD